MFYVCFGCINVPVVLENSYSNRQTHHLVGLNDTANQILAYIHLIQHSVSLQKYFRNPSGLCEVGCGCRLISALRKAQQWICSYMRNWNRSGSNLSKCWPFTLKMKWTTRGKKLDTMNEIKANTGSTEAFLYVCTVGFVGCLFGERPWIDLLVCIMLYVWWFFIFMCVLFGLDRARSSNGVFNRSLFASIIG